MTDAEWDAMVERELAALARIDPVKAAVLRASLVEPNPDLVAKLAESRAECEEMDALVKRMRSRWMPT